MGTFQLIDVPNGSEIHACKITANIRSPFESDISNKQAQIHAVTITTIVKDLTVGTTTRVSFRLNLLIRHEIKSEINSTKTLITARNFTLFYIKALWDAGLCQGYH